jgi:CRP-like cAMP-binding protein
MPCTSTRGRVAQPEPRAAPTTPADVASPSFPPSSCQVVVEGDPGDFFYIILDGEAVVYQNSLQGPHKVNHLFKADFFGERALLEDAPR